jgi:hypothetical protein
MKNLLLKIAFVCSCIILVSSVTPSFAASAIKAGASPLVKEQLQNDVPVYNRQLNANIGITASSNAVGRTYIITDNKGRIIMRGVIRSGKTFFIPVEKLNNGVYQFSIGGSILQKFAVE